MKVLGQHALSHIKRNTGLEIGVLRELDVNERSFLVTHKNSINVEVDKENPVFIFKNRLLIGDYLITMKDFKNISSLVTGKLIINENSLYDFLLKKDYQPKIFNEYICT